MIDGPTLRIRIHQETVHAVDAKRRVQDLFARTKSPDVFVRWNAKLRLPFAEARLRRHEARADWARRRLRGMVI